MQIKNEENMTINTDNFNIQLKELADYTVAARIHDELVDLVYTREINELGVEQVNQMLFYEYLSTRNKDKNDDELAEIAKTMTDQQVKSAMTEQLAHSFNSIQVMGFEKNDGSKEQDTYAVILYDTEIMSDPVKSIVDLAEEMKDNTLKFDNGTEGGLLGDLPVVIMNQIQKDNETFLVPQFVKINPANFGK